MPPDPRDAQLVEAVVSAVRGMIEAVHRDDNKAVVGQLALLVTAIVEHKAALAEPASHVALRHAIEVGWG